MPASARHTGWRRDPVTGCLDLLYEGERVDNTFNVRLFGAKGDEGTADASAIQSAVEKAESEGGGTIVLPHGRYSVPDGIVLSRSNLAFESSERATLISSDSHIFESATDDPFVAGNLTYFALSGNYSRGDVVLALATAADAGVFSVGDFVWVRTRQLVDGNTGQPVAELNRVHAVDSSAGTVTLKWPLAKDYTADGVNTHGIAVTTEVHENIAIRGLRFDAGTRATNLRNLLDCSVEHCVFEGAGAMVLRGRFLKVLNNRGHLAPDWDSGWRPYYLAMDTGTCDVRHEGNNWTSTGTGIFHIHEGVANLRSQANTFQQGKADAFTTEKWPVISVRALSWNVRSDGDTIINSPTHSAVWGQASTVYEGEGNTDFVLANTTVLGSVALDAITVGTDSTGAVTGCRLHADVGTDRVSLRVNSDPFLVDGNDFGKGGSVLANDVTVGHNRMEAVS